MSQTLKELMNESFERYADRTAVRILRQSNEPGEQGLRYVPVAYQQLREQRDRLASGLAQLNLEKGQRIGILTDGGLEPMLIFLATDLLGLSSVPLCNKLPDDILVYMVNHSGIVLLFVDRKSQDQVERIQPRLENPPQVVLTEGQAEGTRSFFNLLKAGEEAPLPEVEVLPDDETKMIYTSGSSGLPKGAVQTHRNIIANVKGIWDVISKRESMVFFKSAPDYHTMGVINIYYPLAKGWTVDLARSPDRVLTDIRHSEPHGFLTVPLILDKVYGNVRKEIEAGGTRGRLIGRAVRAKQKLARGQASLADRLVYGTVGKKVVGQIRGRLADRVGGRLELLIVGSAKADPEALDFFHDVLDITTFEGYGTTESCSLIAVNHLQGRRVGTVGRPYVEVKLVDDGGQEVGYADPATETYRGSSGAVGELWVHGSNVMKEYLDDPEQTAKTLVRDETGKVWYRTGDLFDIDSEGYLTFRGRLGRQFKLRNGEFVNPEQLERLYARVSLIEHVLVCGDQGRDFPLPVVTVNVEEAQNQADIPDLPTRDEEALRTHPAVAERIREALLKEATRAGLPGHERPQKVLVLSEALSEETGTLTRGLKKVVPKEIVKKYEKEIEAAYGA